MAGPDVPAPKPRSVTETAAAAWLRDARHAWRSLRRTPGFTVTVTVTLALGFALTASTLAIVNAYVLRALPYPHADRLYRVIYAGPGQPEPRGLDALDWSTLGDIVEIADSSAPSRLYLIDGAYTQEAMTLNVAPGSLDALGVRVVRGRSLGPGDFAPGAEPVALIGQALWRDRFDADPNIIGRTFRANLASRATPPVTVRIVGVLPPDFRYVSVYARGAMDLVVPLAFSWNTYTIRLRPGVPVSFAARRITAAVRAVAPTVAPDWSVRLESMQNEYVGPIEPVLIALAAAAGLVLLVVCANVAILVLLRAIRRQHEVAVRVALGASRYAIGRLLMLESGILSLLAIVAGGLLGGGALRLLGPMIEDRLGRPVPGGSAALSFDATVVLALGGAGVAIALALGLVPLLASWSRIADALRRQSRGSTDGIVAGRARSALIVGEVAASLALLVGGGLMVRSVAHLIHTDLGLRTEGVTRARIALPDRSYPDASAFLRFTDRLATELGARNGLRFAFTNFPTLIEPNAQRIEVDGHDDPRPVSVIAVSDGFFPLLEIPIRQGRLIAPTDRPGSEPVAVVSESLARRLWPDGRVLGRRVRTGEQPTRGAERTVWHTVVGVVADVRQGFADANLEDIYIAYAQAPNRYTPLMLRSDGAPLPLGTLRAVAAAIDPQVLVAASTPLSIEANHQLAGPRFLMSLLSGFSAFAVLIALIGMHGVVAYAVQQREREIAIRIAIGASHRAVIGLFLRHGGAVLAVGIVCGLAAGAGVARILANQLHGVRPLDPWTLAAASIVMTAAGTLAIWWPARRAARVSPVSVLNTA